MNKNDNRYFGVIATAVQPHLLIENFSFKNKKEIFSRLHIPSFGVKDGGDAEYEVDSKELNTDQAAAQRNFDSENGFDFPSDDITPLLNVESSLSEKKYLVSGNTLSDEIVHSIPEETISFSAVPSQILSLIKPEEQAKHLFLQSEISDGLMKREVITDAKGLTPSQDINVEIELGSSSGGFYISPYVVAPSTSSTSTSAYVAPKIVSDSYSVLSQQEQSAVFAINSSKTSVSTTLKGISYAAQVGTYNYLKSIKNNGLAMQRYIVDTQLNAIKSGNITDLNFKRGSVPSSNVKLINGLGTATKVLGAVSVGSNAYRGARENGVAGGIAAGVVSYGLTP